MSPDLSRRGLLTAAGGAAVGGGAVADAASELKPLTSRTGVYTPARGEGVIQFGFDFPEPSAEVGPLQVSFRIHTFENVYAVDPAKTRLIREDGRVRWISEGLLGSGGQERASGRLVADFELGPDGVDSWRARAELPRPVK